MKDSKKKLLPPPIRERNGNLVVKLPAVDPTGNLTMRITMKPTSPNGISPSQGQAAAPRPRKIVKEDPCKNLFPVAIASAVSAISLLFVFVFIHRNMVYIYTRRRDRGRIEESDDN
jgi:hypothetical protein